MHKLTGLLLLTFVYNALSCGSVTQAQTGLKAFLGGTFNVGPLTDGRTGTPITDINELTCEFDAVCKWGNAGSVPDSSGSKWQLATGQPDPAAWKSFTGSDQLPQEPYSIVALKPGVQADVLKGEVIPCQTGTENYVMFNYWMTRGTTLEVCAVRAGTLTKLYCSPQIVSQDYTDPFGAPQGTAVIQLAQEINEPFEVAFFPTPGTVDGFIAVDNINYFADIDTCQQPPTTTTTTTTTTPATTPAGNPDPAACSTVKCDTEASLCGYQDQFGTLGSDLINSRWERVVNGNPQIGFSRNTRPRDDPAIHGTSYMGTNVQHDNINAPVGRAVLKSPQFTLATAQPVEFDYFMATNGGNIRVCYDTTNFNDQSNPQCETVQLDSATGRTQLSGQSLYWQHYTTSMAIPPGTHNLYIVGEFHLESSAGYAGIAVDNIQFANLSC